MYSILFNFLVVWQIYYCSSISAFEFEEHPRFHLLPYDSCGLDTRSVNSRVMGGQDAILGEFPWMANIFPTEGMHLHQPDCGGSLISSRYVLTAAHCCEVLKPDTSFVRLGEYDLSNEDPDCREGICAEQVVDVAVEEFTIHQNYTDIQHYDICLIRLKQTVKFTDRAAPGLRHWLVASAWPGLWSDWALSSDGCGTRQCHHLLCLTQLQDSFLTWRLSLPAGLTLNFIQPVCLPVYENIQNKSFVGEEMQLAGWGFSDKYHSSRTPVLQTVSLTVVSEEVCQADYYNVGPNEFCAGGLVKQQLRQFCIGDSGGSLMRRVQVHGKERWVVFGVVSWLFTEKVCAGGLVKQQLRQFCIGDSGGPLMRRVQVHGKERWVVFGVVSWLFTEKVAGNLTCNMAVPGVFTRVTEYTEWILENIRS